MHHRHHRTTCSGMRAICQAYALTHFKEREVNLFSVRILLFMHARVQIFHIQYNSKQPVHLFFRHILQVCNVVTWPARRIYILKSAHLFNQKKNSGNALQEHFHTPSVWLQLLQGSIRLTAIGCSALGGVGGGGVGGGFWLFQPLHLQAPSAYRKTKQNYKNYKIINFKIIIIIIIKLIIYNYKIIRFLCLSIINYDRFECCIKTFYTKLWIELITSKCFSFNINIFK